MAENLPHLEAEDEFEWNLKLNKVKYIKME